MCFRYLFLGAKMKAKTMKKPARRDVALGAAAPQAGSSWDLCFAVPRRRSGRRASSVNPAAPSAGPGLASVAGMA